MPYNDTYTDSQTSNSVLNGSVRTTITTYLRTYLRTTVYVVGSGGGDLGGHYVSTSGNNVNDGSYAHPWRTIQYGADHVTAGETLYIRGGTYSERVNITVAGTAVNPIVIMSYPGETAVLDGAYNAAWTELIYLHANYVHIMDLEVRNSEYRGIIVYNSYDLVHNCYVHHCRSAGIRLEAGTGCIVEYCSLYYNAWRNEGGVLPVGWAQGLTAAVDGVLESTYAILRHNIAWMNWGEGISTFESDHVTLEDNISFDNWSANIYISDASNTLCQRNLVYTTGAMTGGSQAGIMMGDEKAALPQTINVSVINNLVYGTHRCFYWWQGTVGKGITNLLVANNTFVNSIDHATLQMSDSAGHSNVNIKNNIVRQDDAQPVAVATANAEVHFDYNCWSKAAPAAAQGANDITDDADLAETDTYTNPLWYKILGTSPAIGQGLSLAEVTDDYWETERATPPCIGAHEFV